MLDYSLDNKTPLRSETDLDTDQPALDLLRLLNMDGPELGVCSKKWPG